MITTLLLSAIPQIGALPIPPQKPRSLQEIGRTTLTSSTPSRPLRTAQGVKRGTIVPSREGAHVVVENVATYVFPNEVGAFFSFTTSTDGRTLLSQGDPKAVEHAFSLTARMYYDGELKFQLDKSVRTDSVLTVSPSGVGLFLYPIDGDSGAWAFTMFDPVTGERQDTDLPLGMRGADPVLVDGVVYFRLFPATNERKGVLAACENSKLRVIQEIPDCIRLFQPKGMSSILLHARDGLSAFDPGSEKTMWTYDGELRPRSQFAWALSPDSTELVVLTQDRHLRGEEPKSETLQVFHLSKGTRIASTTVAGLPVGGSPQLTWEDSIFVTAGAVRVSLALR